MGRTYGSHNYFMHLFTGLKSGVTRFAEATPLRWYTCEQRRNFKLHSCKNMTLNDIHNLYFYLQLIVFILILNFLPGLL